MEPGRAGGPGLQLRPGLVGVSGLGTDSADGGELPRRHGGRRGPRDRADSARCRTATHSLGQKLGHEHGAYLAALAEVYREAASAAGASVVVDSSKAPAQALLARATGLPVVVVHLVRDPRAVAWSHRRAKTPPAGAKAWVTPQRPTAYVAGRWLARNVYIDAKVRPDIRLRYEDVVADPDVAVGAIRQVLDRIRPPSSATEPAWEGTGPGSQHLIAGNPGRFDAGPLVLRPDVEWATAQPRGAWAVATMVASPLLHRYGYPWRPDRP